MSEPFTTVLYVEDREESQYLITRRLRDEGFQIIEARTGQEALDKLSPEIDCVLLDVKLPDIPGIELCHRIKASSQNKFLPVIMISAAYIEDRHQVSGLEGGADAYLIQPVNSDVLIATINALLRISKAEQASLAAAQQVAALEERQRLSRELHDAVAQTLFTSSIMAESLVKLAKTKPELLEERLESIYQLNRSALAEMRNLLFELRLDEASEIHLPGLLQQLVDAVHGKEHFTVDIRINDKAPMPNDLRLTFYRIAQEAFSNVYKHASASHVELIFQTSPGQAFLCIRDNGKGFDQSGITASSMGIKIMRERAETINAQLTVNSVAGQGTEISLLWREAF